MNKKISIVSIIILISIFPTKIWCQRLPNEVENIDYLVTYGRQALDAFGDDDHVQIIFFSIPIVYDQPLYIRIYDPETGGTHDALHGIADTYTRYSIYGGKGAFSNQNAQQVNPKGDFKSGTLLASKVFGANSKYDASWFVFGPFNPLQGEKSKMINGYVFKLVIEGLKGNDGNHYRCFFSQLPHLNQAIEGANEFAYEYTFKLPKSRGVSHIYPFIDMSVTSVTQYNFDYDNDGEILIYSVKKNRHPAKTSNNAQWKSSTHFIDDEERNSTIDIQIQKNTNSDNVMSFYITNQYNIPIPFFAIPIGGPPKYKYKPIITLNKKR